MRYCVGFADKTTSGSHLSAHDLMRTFNAVVAEKNLHNKVKAQAPSERAGTFIVFAKNLDHKKMIEAVKELNARTLRDIGVMDADTYEAAFDRKFAQKNVINGYDDVIYEDAHTIFLDHL